MQGFLHSRVFPFLSTVESVKAARVLLGSAKGSAEREGAAPCPGCHTRKCAGLADMPTTALGAA
eukprot:26727-Amphidinium_carterae.1